MKLRYVLPLLFSTLVAAQTMVIAGQSGKTYSGLNLSSTTGDCLEITGSTNITIRNSKIGPCSGDGIKATNSAGISSLDNYIHPEAPATSCCDKNDGIFASKVTGLQVKGNVIAHGESNIKVVSSSAVTVAGNYLFDPVGPYPSASQFQCWSCQNVTAGNNYALSTPAAGTSDAFNFGGTGAAPTSGFVVQGNLIIGGHFVSGCPIMADTFANHGQVLGNRVLNSGGCGIGITDGTEVVSGNKIYITNPVLKAGNTALYVAHYGKSGVCGPITVTNNVADEIRSDGTHAGWWTPAITSSQSCGLINLSTNTFGAKADALLTPTSKVFAPPLVPPSPVSCVADSPYSQPRAGLQTCK